MLKGYKARGEASINWGDVLNLRPMKTTHLSLLVLFLTALITGILQAHIHGDASSRFTLVHKIKVDYKGPAGAIDGCAFSNNGQWVAASDNHGFTMIYDLETGEELKRFKHTEEGDDLAEGVHTRGGETNAVHFSPDDQLLLTGMNETGCKIWDIETGELVVNLGHGMNCDGAAFSPDGQWVAAGHQALLVVYRMSDFEKVWELEHPGHPESEVNSVDWSPDTKFLVSASDRGGVRVSRAGAGQWEVLYENDFGVNRVKSIRMSPDSRWYVAAGERGRVLIYRMLDGRIQAQLLHPSFLAALPGDDYDDPPEDANVEAVEWSRDGDYVLTGGTYDGILRAFRVADWQLEDQVAGQEYNRQVEYLAVSPHNLVAAGGDEGYLYIYQFHED